MDELWGVFLENFGKKIYHSTALYMYYIQTQFSFIGWNPQIFSSEIAFIWMPEDINSGSGNEFVPSSILKWISGLWEIWMK